MLESLQANSTYSDNESLHSLRSFSQKLQGDRKQIYRQNANAEISNIDSFQKFTSSQASSNSSQVSTSRSIIAAMKRAILQSRSHSSSSSTTGDLTTSNFSRNPEPFSFDRNNSAQQNLDTYIANSRREIPSSTFFRKLTVKEKTL